MSVMLHDAHMTTTWHERSFAPKACIGCGKDFVPQVGFQKRCKPGCGQEKACVVCGALFTPHRNKARQQTACSTVCARKAQTYREKACGGCGQPFQPDNPRQLYCSEACKRPTGTCRTCGEKFLIGKNELGAFCSRACWEQSFAKVGDIRPAPGGYVLVKVPEGYDSGRSGANGRWMLQHRYEMEQKLGRKLAHGENVHHIDGDRANNSWANLELWSRPQPKGVRAADYHCPGCRCHEMND